MKFESRTGPLETWCSGTMSRIHFPQKLGLMGLWANDVN